MAAKIEKTTIIGDVLDIAPQTAPLFMAIGMHCLGCPSSRGETVEEDPHEGEEFGYVLAGSLKIVLGDRVEKVKRDESFYFRPNAPHKLVNAGKKPCKVLWVSTPPSF